VTPVLRDAVVAIPCDIDGNGQEDMIFSINNYGVQSYVNNSVWLNLSDNGTYPYLLLCNDISGDSISEVIGLWGSGAMKYFDSRSWTWISVSLPGDIPELMTSGGFDLDGRDDIIATFKVTNRLMYRKSSDGSWNNIPLGGLPVPNEIYAFNMDTDDDLEIVGVFKDPPIRLSYMITESGRM